MLSCCDISSAILGSTTTHIVMSEADLLVKSQSQENHRLHKDLAAAQSLAGHHLSDGGDATGSAASAAGPGGRASGSASAGAAATAAKKVYTHCIVLC